MHITEPPAGLVALDSDSAAIVVIDRARRILFKNRSAEALLTAGAALTEHHQTLATRTASVEARLQVALRSAARPLEGGTSPRLLSLPRPRGLPLMGLVVALPADAADDLGELLLLWDPQLAPALPSAALAQLFGLTPAEVQTALATFAGHTPAEIAQARGRSVATVRTLLSRVFMKCGVRRQAELVKLLAGIANACSLVDGIQAGIGMHRATESAAVRHAALRHAHTAVLSELARSTDMEATAHVMDLGPGQVTQRHYHTHGHEVLCVLRGDLSTEFGLGDIRVTQSGGACYVAERVLHRGLNRAASGSVQVLSINVARPGNAFRVEQPDLSSLR